MPILPIKKDEIPNTPPPKINDKWLYPYFRVLGANIDLQNTAEGRYSSYFAEIESARSNHLFEFITIIPIVTTENNNHHVYGKSVIGTLSSTSLNGSFSAAVASATANAAGRIENNSFSGQTRGVADAAWNKLRALVGNLSADRVNQLGQALSQSLNWCVEESATGAYSPSAVALLAEPNWNYVDSLTFALNRIRRGRSFEEAKADLNEELSDRSSREKYSGIDLLTVAAVYHRLKIGDGKPNDQQESLAKDIMRNNVPLPPKNNAQKSYLYEVPPFHFADGTVPSLKRLSADHGRIAVHNWPVNKADLGGPIGDIIGNNLDIQTAMRIGSAGVVDFNADSKFSFKRYGFTATRPTNGLPNTIILKEFYTAGFNVRVKTSEVDSKLGVPAIAAKSTLGLTNVSYEIEGLGLSLSILKSLPNFLAGAVGKFDVDTFNSLGVLYEEASNALDNLMTDNNVQPMLTAVELNLGADEIQSLPERNITEVAALFKALSTAKTTIESKTLERLTLGD